MKLLICTLMLASFAVQEQCDNKGGVQTPPQSLTVVSDTLPVATAGMPYKAQIVVMGGRPPYRISGSLPAGLALNPSTGEITGIPQQSGDFTVVVTATDSQ